MVLETELEVASFPGSTPLLFSHSVQEKLLCEKSSGVEPGNEANWR